ISSEAPCRKRGKVMTKERNITQQTITLPGGTKIAYYAGGPEDGEIIVLLHGGGTDHAMLSWQDTFPALVEASYRVIAPDHPGYGNSPPADYPATVDNMVQYVGQFIDALDLQQVTLIGISMGGAMSIGTTLAHPEKVKKLVLIGTYGIQAKAPFHRLSYLFVRLPWMNNLMWATMRAYRPAVRYTVKNIVRNPESQTQELMDDVFQTMKNQTSQRVFAEFQKDEVRWNGMKTNYVDRLHEIKQPVLVVHGSHDVGVPLEAAKQAVTHLPNVRFEIFDEAGHWTQRDYPQKFNALLLEFLTAAS
ncbi:MAG: alpha/beta fold hydrolase, partial [Chloroflexota bacterium]